MNENYERAERARLAGGVLRRFRESLGLSQQQVADRAPDGLLTKQEVSRMEGGGTTRPSMAKLAGIGNIIGLTPNQIAAIYGYWDEGGVPIEHDPRMQEVSRITRQLSDYDKDRLLDMLLAVTRHYQENLTP